MSDSDRDLEALAADCGILGEYHDIWGKRHPVPGTTRRALLAAMDALPADEPDAGAALAGRALRCAGQGLAPAVVLTEGNPVVVDIRLAEVPAGLPHRWMLKLEDGTSTAGEMVPMQAGPVERVETGGQRFVTIRWTLPEPVPTGYHDLELAGPEEAGEPARMRLIVAPQACYLPDAIGGEGDRVWGVSVQLYAVRSRRNWGMGDFTDLKSLVDAASRIGADIVGVNPLHALFPANPAASSPYSPSSRHYWNPLYIDPEAVPEFGECELARKMVADPQFQARLRALRGAEFVAYTEVADVKLRALRLLYAHFRTHHLANGTPYARGFREFQAREGHALHEFALFHALHAHFRERDTNLWSWQQWPQPYQNPDSGQVAEFARSRAEEVEFHAWMQWQAERQIEGVGLRSLELGLGVGLYQDLAVGVAGDSAEVWAEPGLYAEGVSVGAPPDDFNPNGQNWGLPPWVPEALTDAAYEPFIAMLRAAMRHAGALRIDHVMGLMRLFWVPAGHSAAEGAYVRYPFEDLLRIVALESVRNHCMVIGEDLGTVPDEMRAALKPMKVLSYRPLLFEKHNDGSFKAPDEYERDALVAVTTHDLPTLTGFWLGHDLDLRDRLGLYPSAELRARQVVGRSQDRAQLLVALERAQLLPEGMLVHPVSHPEMTAELAAAIHAYLASTPSRIMLVQPEDLLGQLDQVNLPGTSGDTHPNWCRKLPADLEEWFADSRASLLIAALSKHRGGRRARRGRCGGLGRIPRATYRLQLHEGYTLRQATEIVPYLAGLGVSHVYVSPLLKARPGSGHGYDIVDHGVINPEIGSHQDFVDFVGALRAHGLYLMVDVVPNHMGVMGSDNGWWLDVLENGPASEYAGFFDIDWETLKEELRGKVLLPVLGDHYGVVLERGEIRLVFDAGRGALDLWYYEHRFPVDPREYPVVLEHRPEQLAARLHVDDLTLRQYQSLTAAFRHLPGRDERSAEQIAERSRDKELLKHQLADLCARHPALAAFIGDNVAEFNGRPGDSASYDALHGLIKAQAYRLAYWRVASDEINYRRFFDINDLAALRMENEPVFRATHRLLFELIGAGQVDALRIDHPDGLYDPDAYFRRLQEWVSRFCPAGEEGPAVYLAIEKILAEHERIPPEWPVHGTTGYRFANVLNGLFVDTGAAKRMERIYARFSGETETFEDIVYEAKRLIIRTALASELNVLSHQLSRIALANRHTCDFTLNSLRDALTEVVACFPVYRTYVRETGLTEQDRRYIEWAIAVAKKRSQAADVDVFEFLRGVLTLEIAQGQPEGYAQSVLAFAMKFQQYTSPVMAKGLEDTSCYRYNRLASLNEVGGEPRTFGFTLASFHGANQDRARNWPHEMLASSTHDSKRSEDVRARINVISEMPAAWKVSLGRWSRMNRSKKSELDGQLAPSRNDEYLLYQTLIGAWPLEAMDDDGLAEFRTRIQGYMLKAVREAKARSSWINPNPGYERAVERFVDAVLAPGNRNLFLADFAPIAARIARLGLFNSLSQTLIKLTAPGVPDIYQGNELWDFSLVDPDNRRPVDFGLRRSRLDELAAETASGSGLSRALIERIEDGRAKLHVTIRALDWRRRHEPALERADYLPLAADGARAEHLCAYARAVGGEILGIVVASRFFWKLREEGEGLPVGESVWGETWVEAPASAERQRLRNVLSGEAVEPVERDGRLMLAVGQVLENFPVALLELEGSR